MVKRDVVTYIKAPDTIGSIYEIQGDLGAGGFGEVKRAKRIKRPIIHDVALKIVNKDSSGRFKSCVLRPEREEYQARLLQFNHDNVVHYFDFLEDAQCAYVVMPMLTGPSLWARLLQMEFTTERWAQDVLRQMLLGLQYIHTLGVCHRDVTPGNLIFQDHHCQTLKLVDFGLCALDQNPNSEGSVIGTLPFIAPEAWTKHYAMNYDVWSAGVCMHLLLTCRYPFMGANPEAMLDSILKGLDIIHLAAVSQPCTDLIVSMLDRRQMERPSATECLQHEFFGVQRSLNKLVPGSAAVTAHGVAEQAPKYNDPENPPEQPPNTRSLTPPVDADLLSMDGRMATPLLRGHTPHTPSMAHVPMNRKDLLTAAHAGTSYTFAIGNMTTATQVTPTEPFQASEPTKATATGFLSEWDATVALFSLMLGAAILTTPYAFKLAGVFGILLLVIYTVLSGYTAQLLSLAFNSLTKEADKLAIPPEARNWPFIVEAAFGTGGKRVLAWFLLVETWGYVLSYTVVSAHHWHIVYTNFSESQFVVACSVGTYVLLMVPPAFLTKISVLCNMIYICGCLMFVFSGFMMPAKAPQSDFVTVIPEGILAASGILLFNSASHACYPTFQASMAEPARFSSSVRQAYAAGLLFYLLVAVPGYYCLGNAVQQSFIENIGHTLHMQPMRGMGWMSTFAAGGIAVKMLALQPLVYKPFAATVKGLLGDTISSMSVCRCVLDPILLAISGAISCLFAKDMAMLLNIIGSVLCMNIAFVMPVACYWKLTDTPISCPKKLLLTLIMSMGGFFAVSGLINSVAAMMKGR
eukprot:CAMPEP_0172681598 /NCGR_PEP_ID=MMETSP1074-20121228/17566_1 /TAXON_ID=2916 /ORGANISM="Ceratium fusus, Strain PA161109" /LENGTH=803 /DNA_ID=CAMNT_0013500127 /DNA_START=29 /DNA_END=2440 /DNA_ORIENTATION=-